MDSQTRKALIAAGITVLLAASGFGVYELITKNADRSTISSVISSEQIPATVSLSDVTDWDDLPTQQIMLGAEALTITEPGTYILAGTTDQTVNVNSAGAVRLVSNGVTISSTKGPAIYLQNSAQTIIQLAAGTTNKIQNNTTINGTIDGVIYSVGDLIIEGDGNLEIVAEVEHGIVAKNITILSGNITINTIGKAITIAENLIIDGGNIDTINSEEGLEAARVIINGGKIKIYATDDGINASSDNLVDLYIKITGGDITVKVADGDTDALDSNGDLYMSGGTLNITAKLSSFDFDGSATYTGGTIYVNGEKINEIVNSMQMGPARNR